MTVLNDQGKYVLRNITKKINAPSLLGFDMHFPWAIEDDDACDAYR